MPIALTLAALLALGQPQVPADRTTLSGSAAGTYAGLKGFILKSAEKMPAEHFAFQPTPDVRSFGQLLAHMADANYLLCSPALREPNPNGSTMDAIEQQKLGRQPLLDKLTASFEYCDRAYGAMTEANAIEAVPFMKSTRPRVGLLWFHISHAYEHYGNLVTYLRLKGLVPPSSER